jgi:hypothetical protein
MILLTFVYFVYETSAQNIFVLPPVIVVNSVIIYIGPDDQKKNSRTL